MYQILAFGYEFLTELIPFLIVLLLFRRGRGKFVKPFSGADYVLPVVFACYIMAVFHVTGAGTLYDAMTAELGEMQERINLVPFSNKIHVLGYLLNVVMFLPLGFLVPLIWKGIGKFSHILITGADFSLLIELSQLFSYRGTDVDDLILNTLGAAVGFLLYKIWDKITNGRFQLEYPVMAELPMYILAIYFGRFLLFNQLGLINLVYGF